MAGFERRRGAASEAASESFQELTELARSAGAEIVGELFQVRPDPDAATLFGQGKVREIRETADAADAELVIVDNDLSPTQQRNLEKALDRKVIDRTQLILDIFARRARTAEGRLQVELAQLKYLLPRLAGQGNALSRLGGGIGTRGPGETKLETDRRRIQMRIRRLETEIERVRRARELHRRKRDAVPVPTVSLAGYTNAGKSTLFNRLTAAGVLADARMFATLDPTVRSLKLPSRRQILLSDTVGFVRNLPTTLINAFRATLEEIAEAELILHVVDASSEQAGAQVAEVLRVLREIGAGRTPQVLVLNKADRLANGESGADPIAARLLGESGKDAAARAVLVSGLTGEGIAELLDTVDGALPFDPVETVWFRIPVMDGAALAMLHRFGRVRRAEYDGDVCFLETDAPESLRAKLAPYLAPEHRPAEEARTVRNSSTPVENSVHN